MRISVGWLLVLLYLGLAIVAVRSPYFLAFRGATADLMILLGVREWRQKRRGWFPTLSWAVPLGVFWLAGIILIQCPQDLAMDPLGGVGPCP